MLATKINCTIRFGKQLSESSLACLCSREWGSRAGTPVKLLENSLQNLLYSSFCHLVEISQVPRGQFSALLLDEVPDGDDAPARLLGDDLGGVLLLHDAVVDAVLLGLVKRTGNKLDYK